MTFFNEHVTSDSLPYEQEMFTTNSKAEYNSWDDPHEPIGLGVSPAVEWIVPFGKIGKVGSEGKVVGKLPVEEGKNGSVIEYKGPVEPGQVTTYRDSTDRAVVGDNLTGDHMPSRASIQNRVEDELGLEKLDPHDEKWLRDNTGCVVVTGTGHCAMSQTYGGRNNSDRITNDAKNPRQAADSNFDAMIPDLKQQGLSDTEINQARIRLHEMNEDLTGKINERFGTNITY